MRRPLFIHLLCTCIGVSSALRAADNSEAVAFFEKSVRPVLINRCYECHESGKKTKGGLAVDNREALRKGGESGPAVVPGDLDKSKLIEAIRYTNHDLQMPPKGAMPANEVEVLEAWVKMGAPDPRDGKPAAAEKGSRLISMDDGKKHWAFQPVSAPTIPKVRDEAHRVRTPIDQFILAKLEEKGLHLSPEADRRTLIRRATFDLIGLPPTPEEVEAFVNDPRPDAFDAVIERLLASPHYGERWGRHWLDLARYADSNGLDENVTLGHAWRYRDYVVRSFNDNKPFDQFVIEQIAGDLLPRNEDAMTGTGFLSLGAKVLAEPDVQKLQMDIIDEQIDTLGKAFLGMTLGCVRCHDHKFDPLTQEDYYAMAAIFRSTQSLSGETTGAIKYWYEHSLATKEQIEAKKKQEETAKKRRAEVTALTSKTRSAIKAELQSQAADYLAAASLLSMDDAFSEVQRLASEFKLRPRYLLTCRQYLARNPSHPFFAKWRELQGKAEEVRKHYALLFAEALKSKKGEAYDAMNDVAGFLAIPDKDADAFDAEMLAKIEQMNNEAMALESKITDTPAIMGVADGTIVKTLPVHIRGSYLTLGKPVERGFPEVMRTSLTKPVMPAKQSGRLELARWLASSEHPLTSRVMANRLWRWHFGKGIVGTTDNFGLLGEKPSHPELLDYLARTFVENNWSIKDMHRLIMKSAVYQQASSPKADSMADTAFASASKNGAAIDPENRLLWRANIQRLEAEEVRDAMLAVSGWLSPEVGGKTIPLRNKEFVFNHTSRDHTTYESPRRAIYLPIIRNHLYDMLEQFDFPDPTMPTGSRNSTVIAPQALIMLNSPVAMESGERMARQLEHCGSDTDRVRQAYRMLYARDASPNEIKKVLAMLQELLTTEKPDRAWALVCQTLISANEFMYLR